MAFFGFGAEKIDKDKIYTVEIEKVVANPYQPRKEFDTEAINELCLSIKQFGILQPLLVRKKKDTYELIAGERRLKAATQAGLQEVPVIIKEMTDDDSAVVALIENLQRRDLSFMEEANAFHQLVNVPGMTQEMLAERIGKNQSTIANKMRLLKLADPVKRLISEHNLTERHARALLKLPHEQAQLEVLDQIIEKNLNVKDSEELIEQYLSNSYAEEKVPKRKKKAVRSIVSKDVRLFLNTINQALDTMKSSGIAAVSEKKEFDDHIEYSIIIPK